MIEIDLDALEDGSPLPVNAVPALIRELRATRKERDDLYVLSSLLASTDSNGDDLDLEGR